LKEAKRRDGIREKIQMGLVPKDHRWVVTKRSGGERGKRSGTERTTEREQKNFRGKKKKRKKSITLKEIFKHQTE